MDKNREKAGQISALVNDFGFDSCGVAKELSMEHRTLQQNFTRLCVEWLKVCASDNYAYDARNEASHIVSKQLLDGHDDIPALPFV